MSYQRCHPVRDRRVYNEWALKHLHCAACGINWREALKLNRPLSTHHIIKFGRSDEPCVLLRLCRSCHNAAEGIQEIVEGVRVPVLSLANCLFLKKLADPGEWNPDRLTELYGETLPEGSEPDIYFVGKLKRSGRYRT